MPKIRYMDVDGGGLEAGERLRETTFRPPMHETREAEESDRELRPQVMNYDSEGRNLPEIPARSGYTQRWIRQNDPTTPGDGNFHKRWMAGWRPRPLDTIPQAFAIYWQSIRGAKAPDAFEVGQNVLCEMPTELFNSRMRMVHAKNSRMQEIAAEALTPVDKVGGGVVRGFSESNSQSSVGRRPSTMAG